MKSFFLTTEQELIKLIPLIEQFGKDTQIAHSQNLVEVANSLQGTAYLTVIYGTEDCYKSYVCGYYMNEINFMISQLFSDHLYSTLQPVEFLENHLKKESIKNVFAHIKEHPEGFEKFGYKISHYLLLKKLEGQ
jgi:hypothetical protein